MMTISRSHPTRTSHEPCSDGQSYDLANLGLVIPLIPNDPALDMPVWPIWAGDGHTDFCKNSSTAATGPHLSAYLRVLPILTESLDTRYRMIESRPRRPQWHRDARIMIERLLYELREVQDDSVAVEVQSARGTITWEQTVPVDRMVHEERLPEETDPEKVDLMVRFGDRLSRVARGAAWGRFVEYLGRMALNAGLEWLLLNLEGDDYAFLFSTRMQDELEDALGCDAGTLHTADQQFFILTDRRIPADTCYCIRTGNYRLFVRYEFTPTAMRVYLSDLVRMGPRANLAQIDAAKAVHFLRAIRRTRMEPAQFIRAAEENGSSVVATGSRPSNAGPGFARPSSPARVPDLEQRAEARAPERVPEERRVPDALVEASLANELSDGDPVEPLPTECPECGGGLFSLSDAEMICLSCDWNNLNKVR